MECGRGVEPSKNMGLSRAAQPWRSSKCQTWIRVYVGPTWLPTSGSNLGDRQYGNYLLHRSDSTIPRNIQQLRLVGSSSEHLIKEKKKENRDIGSFHF